MKSWAVLVAVTLTLGLIQGSEAQARKTTLKLASLAPEGSTWFKLFKQFEQKVKKDTEGRVKFKVYPGGVAGDEPDLVRKMRVGQLHGAALTSVGLAEIQPEVLVLQAPGLFASWDELYAVRDKMSARFNSMLDDKGYVVLAWGDVGFNRVFANKVVGKPDDLKQVKPWVWTQDGVYRTWYDTAGAKAVPLGVPDVLPGLQTGLINSICTPPLVTVSLQWFTRVKHMLDHPVSVTIGAIVFTKKSLKKLSAEDRAALANAAQEIGVKLAEQVKKDEVGAIDAIRKAGIQVTKPDAGTQKAWQSLADQAADAAAGSIYPKELLNTVRSEVRALRTN